MAKIFLFDCYTGMRISPIALNNFNISKNKPQAVFAKKELPCDTFSFCANIKEEDEIEYPWYSPPKRTLQGSLMDLRNEIKYNGKNRGRKDANRILRYFGIIPTKVGEHSYTLSHYSQPSKDFTFEDLGIKEDSLISGVKEIEDDADFRKTNLFSTREIDKIRGNCIVSGSRLERFPFLSAIYGNLEAEHSAMKSLGNLKNIGGNANCAFSSFKNLGRLRNVGGDLDLTGDYQLESLGCVKEVGGDLYIADTNIRKAKDLEYVGGNIYLRQDQAEALMDKLPTELLEHFVIVKDELED